MTNSDTERKAALDKLVEESERLGLYEKEREMKYKRHITQRSQIDGRGVVSILIRLKPLDGAARGYQKGNLTRTLNVKDAQVGEIASAIESLLFYEEE